MIIPKDHKIIFHVEDNAKRILTLTNGPQLLLDVYGPKRQIEVMKMPQYSGPTPIVNSIVFAHITILIE